jgi:DNA-directed RNA polymerase specialized sigma subunit
MLDDHLGHVEPADCDVLLIDRALDELTKLDWRQGQIVELRYFGGLAANEVAEVLSISRSTVAREWRIARAWLYRRITSGRAGRVP